MFPAILAEAERTGKAVVFGRLEGGSMSGRLPVLAPIPIGWVAVAITMDARRAERLRQLSALPIEVTLLERTSQQTEVLTSTLSVKIKSGWGNHYQTP